jgi:hypothetical protein
MNKNEYVTQRIEYQIPILKVEGSIPPMLKLLIFSIELVEINLIIWY